jgi:hypothetical protein
MFEKLDAFIKEELVNCEKLMKKARKQWDNDEINHWNGYYQCLIRIDRLLKKEEKDE